MNLVATIDPDLIANLEEAFDAVPQGTITLVCRGPGLGSRPVIWEPTRSGKKTLWQAVTCPVSFTAPSPTEVTGAELRVRGLPSVYVALRVVSLARGDVLTVTSASVTA